MFGHHHWSPKKLIDFSILIFNQIKAWSQSINWFALYHFKINFYQINLEIECFKSSFGMESQSYLMIFYNFSFDARSQIKEALHHLGTLRGSHQKKEFTFLILSSQNMTKAAEFIIRFSMDHFLYFQKHYDLFMWRQIIEQSHHQIIEQSHHQIL